jgi:hypothetical protein
LLTNFVYVWSASAYCQKNYGCQQKMFHWSLLALIGYGGSVPKSQCSRF